MLIYSTYLCIGWCIINNLLFNMRRMNIKSNVRCILNLQLINVKLSGKIYQIHIVIGAIKVSAL